MESTPLGVKKGCWTEEEDILLRKCIDKYGEGKWHLVPQRAGLNRCRKSCRLRWLNYLNPNIKRGGFTSDEVDLIKRLHKLLGNRWSLIAGRIPGRTSNDVKNYWNTHLRIKPVAPGEVTITTAQKITTETKVIKPRPRRFTNNLTWFSGNTTIVDVNTQSAGDGTLTNPSPLTSSPLKVDDDHILWWDNMVELDMELIDSMGGSDKELITTSLWTDEVPTGVNIASDSSVQDGKNIGFNDFAADDLDLWDLL